MGDIFDTVAASGSPQGDIFDHVASQPIPDAEAQRIAFVKSQGTPETVTKYGNPYSNITFGQQPPTDTRKISYTDSGYRPNAPATDTKSFIKNLTQDIVEAPIAPVRMLGNVLNAPDTGSAIADLGKGVVKGVAGFVPYLSEPVTGKTAAENWATNPGYGAMTLLGAGKLASEPIKPLIGNLAKNPETVIDSAIQTGIEKGIRPGIAGNRTYGQQTGYIDKAKDAVKTIVANKNKLSLTDADNEPIQGPPQTLKQFSQAIEQTKGQIFKQYNDMAVQAGERQAHIELSPIADELNKVASNQVLQDSAPEVAAYARKRSQAYTGTAQSTDGVTTTPASKTYTPEQAQEAISVYNQSLKAFYQNPSYDTASKAYIDSLVVNQLRKGLDDAIEKSTGEGYQALKNQYGALKAIEADVNRRALVDARSNVKGLIDFSDIFSGSQVVHGIMSMNPATVGTGIAAKFISALYKAGNNPNNIVKKMFEKVDANYSPPAVNDVKPYTPPVAPPVQPLARRVPTELPTPKPEPIRQRIPLGALPNEGITRPSSANQLGVK
jgi:hypothetical protein